jgi:hypothetical protein
VAGEAFVEGGRGRVDIPGRARGGAPELFGGGVPQGASRPVAGAGGDPEVGQPDGAFAVDEDVFRSVVAVDHAALVGGGQAQERALEHDEGGLGRGGSRWGQDVA